MHDVIEMPQIYLKYHKFIQNIFKKFWGTRRKSELWFLHLLFWNEFRDKRDWKG